MPNTRAIILDQIVGDRPQYRVALWADVPVSRQLFYANASATSEWRNASAGDISALQTGAVVEHVEIISADPPITITQAQALVAARWQAFQDYITSYNPWLRYGSTFNGDGTWTAGGVA